MDMAFQPSSSSHLPVSILHPHQKPLRTIQFRHLLDLPPKSIHPLQHLLTFRLLRGPNLTRSCLRHFAAPSLEVYISWWIVYLASMKSSFTAAQQFRLNPQLPSASPWFDSSCLSSLRPPRWYIFLTNLLSPDLWKHNLPYSSSPVVPWRFFKLCCDVATVDLAFTARRYST
jgi:hypothetical protein